MKHRDIGDRTACGLSILYFIGIRTTKWNEVTCKNCLKLAKLFGYKNVSK